jgi:hypothetical protein
MMQRTAILGLALLLTGCATSTPPLTLYSERYPRHCYASGLMGDIGALRINSGSADTAYKGDQSFKIKYDIQREVIEHPGFKDGWSGLCLQYPANNWGAERGKNLSNYHHLEFWIRGYMGGEPITVQVGGKDNSASQYKEMILSRDWQKVTMPLGYRYWDIANLLCISFSSKKSLEPATVYLDEIRLCPDEACSDG